MCRQLCYVWIVAVDMAPKIGHDRLNKRIPRRSDTKRNIEFQSSFKVLAPIDNYLVHD